MGHKRLDPTASHARHIAVRLTDQDRAWVMEQARARGVSAAAILRAGLALLRAPQGASPDLLVGDPPVGSIAWSRARNIHLGGCTHCPTPTGCNQEKFCDRNRRPWVPLASGGFMSAEDAERLGALLAEGMPRDPFTMGPAWRAALAAGAKKNPRR